MPATLLSGADLGPWRVLLGWSVTRAATELRIQPTSLRNLESGRKSASATLLRLAELLEHQHAAPTPAPAPTVRPARKRKPLLTADEAYEAAVSRARLGPLSPEAARVLRTEVDRQRARPWDPEPYRARQERERAWEAVTVHAGALWLSASLIALSMPR